MMNGIPEQGGERRPEDMVILSWYLRQALVEDTAAFAGRYGDEFGVKDMLLAREEAFARAVVRATATVAEGNDDPVALLFDINFSIAATLSGDHHPEQLHVVRPGFGPLIEYLHDRLGDRLHVGLLTTHPADELHGEARRRYLSDPRVASSVDENFLLSCRSYPGEGVTPVDQVVAEDFDPSYSDPKLAVLADLLDNAHLAEARYRFVWVDDTAVASMIRPDAGAATEGGQPRLVAAHLGPGERFM